MSGVYGRLTQNYVKKFQQEQGLPANGIVGTYTRAKIAGICREGSLIPSPLYPTSSYPDSIKLRISDNHTIALPLNTIPSLILNELKTAGKINKAYLSLSLVQENAICGGSNPGTNVYGDCTTNSYSFQNIPDGVSLTKDLDLRNSISTNDFSKRYKIKGYLYYSPNSISSPDTLDYQLANKINFSQNSIDYSKLYKVETDWFDLNKDSKILAFKMSDRMHTQTIIMCL